MVKTNITRKFALLIPYLLPSICTIACNNAPNQPASQPAPSINRHHLKGKVVSIDKQAHTLNVDGEAIPGFMSAMTMSYKVKPESELDNLAPGQPITAEVVVQGDDSWLENIMVTPQSAPPPSK